LHFSRIKSDVWHLNLQIINNFGFRGGTKTHRVVQTLRKYFFPLGRIFVCFFLLKLLVIMLTSFSSFASEALSDLALSLFCVTDATHQ